MVKVIKTNDQFYFEKCVNRIRSSKFNREEYDKEMGDGKANAVTTASVGTVFGVTGIKILYDAYSGNVDGNEYLHLASFAMTTATSLIFFKDSIRKYRRSQDMENAFEYAKRTKEANGF